LPSADVGGRRLAYKAFEEAVKEQKVAEADDVLVVVADDGDGMRMLRQCHPHHLVAKAREEEALPKGRGALDQEAVFVFL
jgi:hypothetical protein